MKTRVPRYTADIFLSDATGKPFEHCCVCETNLAECTEPYMVEKAFKQHVNAKPEPTYNTIFEYAICSDCAEDFRQKMSKASREALEGFFIENTHFTQRMDMFNRMKEQPVSVYISHCAISGKPINKEEEFQVVGVFMQKELQLGAFPYAISGKALDNVVELLSNETLDEMNGFRDTYLGGPPELEELIQGSPRVILV